MIAPEPLYEHFDYMMKRLAWKDLGKAALLNTEEYREKVAFTLFSGINDFVNRKR